MATRSTEADLAEVQRSMGLRLLTFSLEHARERSVALITAETSEAFPPAGGRVLEVVSMEAVAAVIGNHMSQPVDFVEEFKNGEDYHAAQNFDCCSA